MPDKYTPEEKKDFDILPLAHPALTRTIGYYKSEQFFINTQNKITQKNRLIVFTKKKK